VLSKPQPGDHPAKINNLEVPKMKKVFAIALALVLALTLLTACGGNGNTDPAITNGGSGGANLGEKTKKYYYDLTTGGTYHMKYKSISAERTTITDAYYKNGMTAFITDMPTWSIFRDNKTYALLSELKMYSSMDVPASSGATGKFDGIAYAGAGTSEFNGKTLDYEEYTSEAATMLYFFDGNALAGWRAKAEGYASDTILLAFDQNVPDHVFEIPRDYTPAGQ
jgi:hypothetical protein